MPERNPAEEAEDGRPSEERVRSEERPEVEEHALKGRFGDEDGAEEDQGSGEGERGEQDRWKHHSDARLKAGIAPLP